MWVCLLFLTLLCGIWALPLDKLDLYEASIAELQSGSDKRCFTSVDLAYLARIDQVNHAGPKLNAVIETNTHALEQARALDEERKLTGKRSALHGIPILVKGNIATLASEGMNTTAGSYALLGSIEKPIFPNSRKLEDTFRLDGPPEEGKPPTHTILAQTPGSLGTETDGSIICPSSFNNLVGIKPTVGLTSRTGVISISTHQDTLGPITRSVADAATILTIIAGQDARDNFTSTAPSSVPDYTQFLDTEAIKGKRFGIPRNIFMNYTLTRTHPSVHVEFERALERIKRLGGIVVDPADFPSAEEMLHSPELFTGRVQFKVGLNAYIESLAHVPTNVSSITDVIAFNDAHKDLEEPEGHEDQSTLVIAEATMGYNST
ncbi:unnamed protein product [Rhizoctonia solani]|uniref:Amidase domain-containing protein n=1 Tax=Rhizoctonia solani TaxID=456999 RepID=A0A8H3GVY3_9AGAM|nr:unnamed protein product [Rhizoctonia solani]